MSCKECCRSVFRKTASVIHTVGPVDLVVNNVPSPIVSGQIVRLCIAQTVPTVTPPTNVVILTNGIPLGLYNSCGELVYSDQIRSRRVYTLRFSASLMAWVVDECELCCTRHLFNPAPVGVPDPTPEEP